MNIKALFLFCSILLPSYSFCRHTDEQEQYHELLKQQVDQPHDAVTSYNLGVAAYTSQKYEQAAQHFDQAQKNTPHDNEQMQKKIAFNYASSALEQLKSFGPEYASLTQEKLDTASLLAKKAHEQYGLVTEISPDNAEAKKLQEITQKAAEELAQISLEKKKKEEEEKAQNSNSGTEKSDEQKSQKENSSEQQDGDGQEDSTQQDTGDRSDDKEKDGNKQADQHSMNQNSDSDATEQSEEKEKRQEHQETEKRQAGQQQKGEHDAHEKQREPEEQSVDAREQDQKSKKESQEEASVDHSRHDEKAQEDKQAVHGSTQSQTGNKAPDMAVRFLDALDEQEQELQKKLLRKKTAQRNALARGYNQW